MLGILEAWAARQAERDKRVVIPHDRYTPMWCAGVHVMRDTETGQLYVARDPNEGWTEVPGGLFPEELRIKLKDGTVL